MKINPKSQKGAITLVVLVAMLFLTAFLMSMYIGIANKAKTSAETTKQIQEKYNNIEEAKAIYDSYFVDAEVIPIYTKEQLKKIGLGEQVTVNGKIYTFSPNAYYTIQNDLDLGGYYNETTGSWTAEEEWMPLTSSFTGVLDGLGNTITGLYINDAEASYQGLFGTLKGTVKNLKLFGSYISANEYVGAIAGLNEGTIENCYNKATVVGANYVGGIAGNLSSDIINCYNTGSIIGTTNVTGGYFKSITTGEILDVWSDNVLDENVHFVSGSYTATAPKGFKVSKNIFEQTIEEGMVIQDAEENEFVWVPVEIASTDTATSIASFFRSEWVGNDRGNVLTTSETYIEPYTKNEWEVEEYNEMVKSVYNNGGFYIGRYETGSKTQRYEETNNGTTDMVIKPDQYPYVWVAWGTSMNNYTDEVIKGDYNYGKSAVTLSKELYGKIEQTNKYGAVSTLCYGVQYDAVLEFINDVVDVNNSVSWGNYQDSVFEITRGSYTVTTSNTTLWKSVLDLENKMYKKENGIGSFITTGTNEKSKAKNIYDIAGNFYELTMEVNGSDNRVNRGGCCYNLSTVRPASYRYQYNVSSVSGNLGFRVALYVI